MKTNGEQTYWGREFDADADEMTKKLLGRGIAPNLGGRDAAETEAREQAKDILEDPAMEGFNARQLMLRQKQVHGTGVNLPFFA